MEEQRRTVERYRARAQHADQENTFKMEDRATRRAAGLFGDP
jgi:hypothetical protein